MSDAQHRLQIARELIRAGEYDAARAILRTMPDNPTAVRWLKTLESTAPARQERINPKKLGRQSLEILVPLIAIVAGIWLLAKFVSDDDESEIPQLVAIPTMALTEPSAPSATPYPTVMPSATPTVTPTPSFTATATQTLTPQPTYTPIPSNTPHPTETPIPPTPTEIQPTPTTDWRTLPTTIYYVTSQMANIRVCASTSCQSIRQVPYRTPLDVISIVTGESLQGNGEWMHLNLIDTNGYIHSSVVSLELPPPPTIPPPPSATPVYGSQDYPLPAGSWLKFDSGQVRATRHIRPADSTVASFNMFNADPSVGAEYVLVWFEVYCERQTCDPGADLDIRLIDNTGQLWGEMLFEVLEPDLDMMSGLQGSTLAGWQLFEVPIGRGISRIQVKWPKWFSDPLYVNWG